MKMEEIAARIITDLQAGKIPWRMPWVNNGRPVNALTKRQYTGSNVFALAFVGMLKGYDTPQWATFNQGKELGGMVRKGEKATSIIVPMILKDKKDDGTEGRKVRFLHRSVFNVAQFDGLPDGVVVKEARGIETIPTLESVLDSYPEPKPKIEHGGDSAHFNPLTDVIRMPNRERFHSDAEYFSTLIHEAAHSTGHVSRLNRLDSRKTDEGKAFEEIVAEMASCFLMADAGVEVVWTNQVAYIASWIKIFTEKPNTVYTASAQALKAVQWIQGESKGKTAETETEKSEEAAA